MDNPNADPQDKFCNWCGTKLTVIKEQGGWTLICPRYGEYFGKTLGQEHYRKWLEGSIPDRYDTKTGQPII